MNSLLSPGGESLNSELARTGLSRLPMANYSDPRLPLLPIRIDPRVCRGYAQRPLRSQRIVCKGRQQQKATPAEGLQGCTQAPLRRLRARYAQQLGDGWMLRLIKSCFSVRIVPAGAASFGEFLVRLRLTESERWSKLFPSLFLVRGFVALVRRLDLRNQFDSSEHFEGLLNQQIQGPVKTLHCWGCQP
jgi:hypothetical protein